MGEKQIHIWKVKHKKARFVYFMLMQVLFFIFTTLCQQQLSWISFQHISSVRYLNLFKLWFGIFFDLIGDVNVQKSIVEKGWGNIFLFSHFKLRNESIQVSFACILCGPRSLSVYVWLCVSVVFVLVLPLKVYLHCCTLPAVVSHLLILLLSLSDHNHQVDYFVAMVQAGYFWLSI